MLEVPELEPDVPGVLDDPEVVVVPEGIPVAVEVPPTEVPPDEVPATVAGVPSGGITIVCDMPAGGSASDIFV